MERKQQKNVDGFKDIIIFPAAETLPNGTSPTWVPLFNTHSFLGADKITIHFQQRRPKYNTARL